MNNILELKGRFEQKTKKVSGGGAAMNAKINVSSRHLKELKYQIEKVKAFWDAEQKPFKGILISVYYNKIVAKSNRIGGLFKGKDSNKAVVGAKFNPTKDKHIITYFLDTKDLDKSISLLLKTEEILSTKFNALMNKNTFDDNNKLSPNIFKDLPLPISKFKQIIADTSYIEYFKVEETSSKLEQSIITLYDVKEDIRVLLSSLGIMLSNTRILDGNTVFLDKDELKILLDKAPYLVSMATMDLSKLSPYDFKNKDYVGKIINIPAPTIEPTIGVIDTLFDKEVYFTKWVEYHDLLHINIPRSQDDYRHGTAVSSIVVDGASLNPWLDDGCGRFKVRHFGVANAFSFSSFSIIKQIKEIVLKNRDIKVWNISLGSNQEVNDNFISAEAAALDKIQYDSDVIFVIAGTNKASEGVRKIGSPADSINSMVVNAVSIDGKATKYAREGIVLSFFAKPDVSYYGGSKERYIKACEPLGAVDIAGTSFAAPWIARKLSYLIDILGFSKEIAKALLIDAARGWDEKPTARQISLYGHGIVPIKIDDIINTREDEIKFTISAISEKYNTYNYRFPVPLKDGMYPYIARATMCYFPMCNSAQGVDYTNTELSLHFGRINDKGKIQDIKQEGINIENEIPYLFEADARGWFRKWDNVKYVSQSLKKNVRPKKYYEDKMWGMEIKTNNRLDSRDGRGLRFGIVVTLREINGINRIEDFIRACHLNGWLVNKVDIKNKIDIHAKINEEILFE